MKTTDGGVSWNYIMSTHTISKLFFTDENTGYGISGNQLLKTTNGALSWNFVVMDDVRNYEFLDANTVFAVGNNGNILKSVDAGSTTNNFTSSFTNLHLQDIQFVTEQMGYVIGSTPNQSNSTEIYKTTDTGQSWNTVSSIPHRLPAKLFFSSSDQGYIAFKNGLLYKTIDGGINWEELQTNLQESITDLFFTNDATGFICVENIPSKILRSQDEGITWQVVFESDNSPIRALHFINENTGFALISDGRIIRTDNGGNDWQEYYVTENELLLDIYFVDQFNGYVGGFSGDCYRTTDGGLNWEYVPLPDSHAILQFYFLNETTGYALADAASVYITDDGGSQWHRFENLPSKWYKGISFVSPTVGFICGDDGLIMKTNNGGIVSLPVQQTVSKTNLLYPNPAQHAININLTGYENILTEAYIYDISGRLVSVLNRENLTQAVDISFLTSGVYQLLIITSEKETIRFKFIKQ
jgi:photosystem II stability/assembly factor-like uncharacterized protein